MHGLQTLYTIRTFNSLRFAVFSGFLYEQLIFYELFCEGTSDLRIYSERVQALDTKRPEGSFEENRKTSECKS